MNPGYIISIFFTIIFVTSCSKKLPLVSEADVHYNSKYGAYIEVRLSKKSIRLAGELISANDQYIIVKTEERNSNLTSKIEKIQKEQILAYNIFYASNNKEKIDTWSNILALSTITHGFWLLITLPVNLITKFSVSNNKYKEFSYSNKEIPYESLYKFARFPQGLPDFITLENIDLKLNSKTKKDPVITN